MRIPQETILAIEEAVQVEEVLSDFFTLQKKGKKYLCPFHQDNHPSFSITADGKFYKCFSCQAKGNAIAFLIEQQGMHYVQAMEYLATKYRIPWQVDAQDKAQIAHAQAKEALHILLDKAKTYYETQLQEDKHQVAYRYLSQRALASPILRTTFGLGYSQPQWQGFRDFAVRIGYDDALLAQAGLIITKTSEEGEKRTYDRFRGRLMFPIHDIMGKVIGFAARHLGKEEQTPKYINSPQTPVYQKSFVLYGLYQAKQAIQDAKNCYLVEGYTDVLGLHEAGVKNVVASGGTALTTAQISLLRRFTPQITLLFDGDLAGQSAALRGIDLLLAQSCDVKIICLPNKEDPDSFRKSQSSEALQAYLKTHAQDFITFKARTLFEQASNDPTKRAEATHQLLTTIAAIPDPIKRTFYLQHCSQSLGLPETLLQEKITTLLRRNSPQAIRHDLPKHAPKSTDNKVHPTSSLERTILYMLLHYPTHLVDENQRLADYILTTLGDFTFSNIAYQTLWDQFTAQWYTQGTINTEDFLRTQGIYVEETARMIMQKSPKPSDQWEHRYNVFLPREEDNLLTYVKRDIQRLQRAHLTEAIRKSILALEQANTQEEQERHLSKSVQLIKKQSKLAKSLSTVVLPHEPYP